MRLNYRKADYPTSSRVIYTARGGHTNPADAHPSSTTGAHKAPKTTTNTKPPALKLQQPHPHDAPWLDSAGHGFDAGGGGFGGGVGGGGGGGTRSRAYSANSAGAAGLQSPRYLQSTTVSQAKAVEPSGRDRAGKQRSSSSRVSGGGSGARRGRGRASLGGGDSDVGYGGSGSGAGGVGFGGPGGMLESLGGFLGIGKGAGAAGGVGAVAGAGGKDATRWGKGRRQSRNTVSFFSLFVPSWLFCLSRRGCLLSALWSFLLRLWLSSLLLVQQKVLLVWRTERVAVLFLPLLRGRGCLVARSIPVRDNDRPPKKKAM